MHCIALWKLKIGTYIYCNVDINIASYHINITFAILIQTYLTSIKKYRLFTSFVAAMLHYSIGVIFANTIMQALSFQVITHTQRL